MIPVVFNDCLGTLYPAEAGVARGRAVIICDSFGYEALCTQRAMLTLARMCADAGLTALRFNYPGTGDSAGDEAPGQIDRWIDSIGAAAAYLRATCGVTDVAVCGFRFGGLLAIEAARRFVGVDALVLLAPVLSGRAYGRELILTGAMVESRADSLPPDWREILGYRLHAADLARLREIDLSLTRGAGAAPRILLVAPEPKPADLDPSITFRHFQHFDGLMQHAQDIVMPLGVFGDVVSWLAADAAPGAPGQPATHGAVRLRVQADLVETPLRFGEGAGCFGILTQHDARRHDCAVLILNSGLNHHTGNGRGSVRLARRLAAAGVTTLRMDMRRIGECAPPDPRETVGFHDLARVRDVQAALDVLQQAGHSRVLLTGICSGAYIGLHALAADARIRAAVLVNLPYFYIRDEDPAIPLAFRPFSLLMRLLDRTRRGRWALGPDRRPMLGAGFFRRRYLAGRAMLLLHYAGLTVQQRAVRLLDKFASLLGLRGRAVSGAERLLRRISALGAGLTLVYSGEDWGLIELGIVFSDHGRRLLEQGWASIRLIEGADHTMTAGWMQDAYAAIIEDKLGLSPAPQAAVDAGARTAAASGPDAR